MKKIRIALAGNPNCGKTTLFNLLTGARQHVGNWPGVTVEKKEGPYHYKGHEFEIIDLPGTYSLTPNSIEEIVSRNFIVHNKPDLVINVVDGTTLERSLYLTSQIIDTHIPMVLAVNMSDEMEKKGILADYQQMETLLGMPVIPIAAKKEAGVEPLFDRVLEWINKKGVDPIHIGYGEDVEAAITRLECSFACSEKIVSRYETRWLAVTLLSGDKEIYKEIQALPSGLEIIGKTEEERVKLKDLFKDDPENLIDDQRFGFILGIIRECVKMQKSKLSRIDLTETIDKVVLHKTFGYPIFGLVLWLTFQLTFIAGGFFSKYLSILVNLLSGFISQYMPGGMLKDLLTGGVISGVGGILVFMPQIMILFLVIAILEDSGYMARVAFIMDRAMHFLGIHGKSFISLFMGIGCNVPGIMAARTLENESDRKVTVLINPFMSCSARLPIYVLIGGMFFGKAAGTAIFSLYFIGILVAVVTAKILKTFFFKGLSVPFVMELPPYRTPSIKSLLVHMWERASQFLRKMGGVILVGSIIIWALGYFPRTTQFSESIQAKETQAETIADAAAKQVLLKDISIHKQMEQMQNSAIGRMGKAIEPFFRPLGLGWKEGVSLITGVIGKEIVVSTMSVLYGTGSGENSELKRQMSEEGMTPAAAFGFLVFVLLYIPCLATIAAVRKETNSSKWTLFSIFYGIAVGYILAFIAVKIGFLLGFGGNRIFSYR